MTHLPPLRFRRPMTTPTPSEKLASDLESAAVKLAAVKIAADDRRENRELIRAIVLGLFVALPGIIASCIAAANNVQGKTTHDLVNSRMSELLEKVEAVSHAEGVAEGKAGRKP